MASHWARSLQQACVHDDNDAIVQLPCTGQSLYSICLAGAAGGPQGRMDSPVSCWLCTGPNGYFHREAQGHQDNQCCAAKCPTPRSSAAWVKSPELSIPLLALLTGPCLHAALFWCCNTHHESSTPCRQPYDPPLCILTALTNTESALGDNFHVSVHGGLTSIIHRWPEY